MKNFEICYTKNFDDIEALGSAITLEGLILEDCGKFLDWCESQGAKVKHRRVWVTTGSLMNSLFDSDYPQDLSIVSIDLDDLEDAQALIFPKLQLGARWMDDIVSNLKRRKYDDEESKVG